MDGLAPPVLPPLLLYMCVCVYTERAKEAGGFPWQGLPAVDCARLPDRQLISRLRTEDGRCHEMHLFIGTLVQRQ